MTKGAVKLDLDHYLEVLARKPGALSRDLLKDFPSGKRRKKRSRNKKKNGEGGGHNGQHQDAADGEGRGDQPEPSGPDDQRGRRDGVGCGAH